MITPFAFPTDEEITLLKKVCNGELRIVHKQRKRTLRKRGVICTYSHYFGAWLWNPLKGGER